MDSRLVSRARAAVGVGLVAAMAMTASACGNDDKSTGANGGQEQVSLRLGYFPNVTHAAALVGVNKGLFQKALGPNVTLKTSTFSAGPAAVEAIFSGAIDATYVGPNPAITAFTRSKGEAIRIISGATSGGAFLVVKPSINSAADLKGKKLATPQLGNTQDVALRAWLRSKDLKTDAQGGGDVKILPQENAQTLETFKSGQIDGAWVPEPWGTRLVQEGKGKVLVDERTLWPRGRYVTTQLIVRTAFLKSHRDVVERLLQGHMEATDYVNTNTADAQKVVNDGIEKVTSKRLKDSVITAAWKNLTFTHDPIASSLKKMARDAEAAGFVKDVDLDGIYDLDLLNKVLKRAGEKEVTV